MYRKIQLFDVDIPGGMMFPSRCPNRSRERFSSGWQPHRPSRLDGLLQFEIRGDLSVYQVLLVPSAFSKLARKVIAAAQTGKNNEKRESFGDSLIIDPWGTVVVHLPDRLSPGIPVADIDLSLLDSVRTRILIAQVIRTITLVMSD